MDSQQTSSKKIWMIIGLVVIVLLIAVGAFFFFFSGKTSEGGIRSVTTLFGNLGAETSRESGGVIQPGTSLENGNPENGVVEEPLFRQLSTIPIAGATSLIRDGKTYVRYIARENGYTYEVDPVTGATTQLTNTTIPRIYEANWANSGNSIVLRYLDHNNIYQDTIKTYIAHLSLPKESMSSTTVSFGTLVGDHLPDNISEVSVSPDGTKLFYLLPVADGVSGTIVNVSTQAAKEVLRSSFSEWLPQLLDNGTIVLTTKPSAKIEGFSYLYNPQNKTFSRILRKINGLTTLAQATDARVLYSENNAGDTKLGVYDKNGYVGDEGVIYHENSLQLATLPEKCTWFENQVRIFCGAFTSTPKAEIPDDWYQGTLSFTDIFWTIDTNTSEVAFLADPTKEETANQSFDVFHPFTGGDEAHFFFTNKNDATLWSMRIMKEKYTPTEEDALIENMPELTPDELKDATGSN